MFRAGYTEEVDRSKRETFTVVERDFDLLTAITPCAIFVHHLEASEVRCTRTEKYVCPAIGDCYLRGDDIWRPFDPVPPGSLYEVGRIISPVRLAIAIPGIVAKYLVFKHNKGRGGSGRKCGEAIGVRFPATPAIGVGARFPLSGLGIRLHGPSIGADDANHRSGSVTPNLIPDFQGRQRHIVFLEMGVVLGVDQHPLAELVDPDLVDPVVSAIVFEPRPAA